MATGTICGSFMPEGDVFPIIGCVATLAVLLVMVARGDVTVAIDTFSITFVVETGRFPTIATVACRTLPFVMVVGGGGLMATCAIRIAVMIEGVDVPIFNVGVATDTSSFVMLGGCIWNMTALAFCDVFMGVAECGPFFDVGMAQDAVAWVVGFGACG